MNRYLFVFPVYGALILSSVVLAANEAPLTEVLERSKDELIQTEETSRNVMSTLYDINVRMKDMSKKRDALNNRMINVEGNVKALTDSTNAINARIFSQRKYLSKRLRAMYMLGDQTVVRTLFSANSAQDLEKSLKFLKIIATHDYELIKTFEKNLILLREKKVKVDLEMKKLVRLKERLHEQENDLEKDQDSKNTLLAQLKNSQQNTLNRIKKLRSTAEALQLEDIVDTSFYENKGSHVRPVEARLMRGYGLIENDEFHYRLAHKGYTFATVLGDPVKAISHGTVAFVGEIAGYGLSVIVDHADHFYSVYAKNSRSLVRKGQAVDSGMLIAQSNREFYFEIRHFSDAINPEGWLTTIERVK